MSSSSIFSSNRKFLATVVLAFLTFFAIDHALYNQHWFLDHFGYGTYEGQIVSKMERAQRLASVADVIFFGSSLIRSGISSEPFLERDLLPLNMGVAGAGPLCAYYELEQLKPILAQRDQQPVIVIEINTWPLSSECGSGWAEYDHLLAAARSRRQLLQQYQLLYQNFKAYGIASQLLSSLILPSGTYRSHNLALGSQSLAELRALVTPGYGKQRVFLGPEDSCGFAPLYYLAALPPDYSGGAEGVPPTWVAAKLKFLRMFVRTATALGARVVLLAAPTYVTKAEARAFDQVAEGLQEEFPNLTYLRHAQHELRVTDFADGHFNIWGSDRFSACLIERLQLRGNRDHFKRKWDSVFDQVAIPSFAQWKICDPSILVSGGESQQLELPVIPSDAHVLAVSPPLEVTPGRNYLLEFSVHANHLPIYVAVHSADESNELIQSRAMAGYKLSPTHSATRSFMHFIPKVDRIRITAGQYKYADQNAQRSALRFLRLVCDRDN